MIRKTDIRQSSAHSFGEYDDEEYVPAGMLTVSEIAANLAGNDGNGSHVAAGVFLRLAGFEAITPLRHAA